MGKHKKNNVVRAYKSLLQNDKDWDFIYLLQLEQKKMRRMLAYFSQPEIAKYNKRVIKEISLCLRLLNIVLEEEKLIELWRGEASKCYNVHSHRNTDGKMHTLEFEYTAMPPQFPKYVNIRNGIRFKPTAVCSNNISVSVYEQKLHEENYKDSLRQAKAWHLYNVVREYKMQGWWD